MSRKRPIAIELFSGVGGMSLGFKQAGFRVIGAFDHEKPNVDAYRQNFPSTQCHQVDLRRISGDDLLRKINADKLEVDLVFGGPPCQGFSLGGLRDLDDERNLLVYEFSRLVREIRPKYFVLENVQGLMIGHAYAVVESFVRRVRRAGYEIAGIHILDSMNFGIPQKRRRTFILGHMSGLNVPASPQPTQMTDDSGRSFRPVVRDAIGDLPNVDDFEHLAYRDGYTGKLGTPSYYSKIMRGLVREDTDTYPRKIKIHEPLRGCLRTLHSKEVAKRFERTLPGQAEPISRFFRLDYDGVCPTLRAGTGNDRGHHTAPRPIHPEYPRCITVREAARLHSYPDWFQFNHTRWHAFRQLGNSVPPRLARFVARTILKVLD